MYKPDLYFYNINHWKYTLSLNIFNFSKQLIETTVFLNNVELGGLAKIKWSLNNGESS